MANKEDALALKRALLDHAELQKPSQPAVQSIVINAGDDNSSGILSGISGGSAAAALLTKK